jgi:hypothetical protein
MIKAARAALVLLVLLFTCGISYAAGVDVISGLTDEAVLQPGAKKDGRIVLRNTADTPQEVKVYQTDYTFRCDGTNAYDKPGACKRSNGPWITFSPQQFTIPPRETFTVYYTVQTPKDDKLTGTYWSMLMVEPVMLAPPPVKEEQNKVRVGLQTVIRYGVQIVTNIGGTGKKEVKFADKQLVARDGKRFLQLDLENTGERWLRPTVWAEVFDDKGVRAGRFESGRTRIYPGCSTRNSIDLGSLKAGKYQALVVIDSGDESVWGAQYALEIR